ncbi:MAG TPA: Crp/Fnr family transcriptional regulator [Candidatus Limnocylindrales bacterium]|nr:Crp/Fnr family transcriptional regulator [Candidatus Limnocylindrales bacterium]
MEVTNHSGRQSRLIEALSTRERARVTEFLEPVELESRDVLESEGDPIRCAVFPANAVTSTLMELPEGDTVEVGLMGAEGVVGLPLLYGQRIANATVIVQIPGHGLRIPADVFAREVVEHGGEFYRLLLRHANMFSAMVAQGAACNASHGVDQRLARWILQVHDRVGTPQFPLTHEFIALMLGVRRASVSEAASRLRQAGAIDYRIGAVRVTGRAELEAAACGCYAVMRRFSDNIFTDDSLGGAAKPHA